MEPPQHLLATCQCLVTLTLKQKTTHEIFPDVHRDSPVLPFLSISSCPITGHHCKEPGLIFFKSSLQIYTHINRISPSLLQDNVSASLASLGKMLWCLNHLKGGPLLDSSQYVLFRTGKPGTGLCGLTGVKQRKFVAIVEEHLSCSF